MALKLPKIVQCLQVFADLLSRSIKAIYLCPRERTYHALSENNMFYRSLSNSSQDIELTQHKLNKIHQLQLLIS